MEQVNKFTEAVTQMTSSHNANKLAARSIAEPENSDNSDFGADDEVNDKPNRVTIHETDCSLYNEANLAAFFLSHLETSSFSVARILSLSLCLSGSACLSVCLSLSSLKTVGSSIPTVLSLDNGDTITNPNDIANTFNNYFAFIAETTKKSIKYTQTFFKLSLK